jgi:hypothetical protein
MDRRLLKPFMWLGIAGFIASALVHVRALEGLPSPFGPATWVLHIGIFVIWLPAVLVGQRLTKTATPANAFKAPFRGCPAWVQPGSYVLLAYAMVNFFLFFGNSRQYPKGAVPDLVEYRGFSGHWMLFYYVGVAMLYSAIRLGRDQPPPPQ